MYTTIRADSIKPGFVISLSMQMDRRKYYILRVLSNGNSDSVLFVAKPFDDEFPAASDQRARPFILESTMPIFSCGYVKFKHSHIFQGSR